MNESNAKQKNRLRELRELENVTRAEMSQKFHMSEHTLKSIENGNRGFSVELASVIATEYNVTLDWLFCRCDYRDDIDLMLNIICALDKVLKVGYKSIRNPDSNYINRELALWMDKEFREYLTEIQELQDAKQLTRQITDERYSNIRRDIQAKYKEYFYQLLGIKSCEINETRFIELETVEGADILTLLQG